MLPYPNRRGEWETGPFYYLLICHLTSACVGTLCHACCAASVSCLPAACARSERELLTPGEQRRNADGQTDRQTDRQTPSAAHEFPPSGLSWPAAAHLSSPLPCTLQLGNVCRRRETRSETKRQSVSQTDIRIPRPACITPSPHPADHTQTEQGRTGPNERKGYACSPLGCSRCRCRCRDLDEPIREPGLARPSLLWLLVLVLPLPCPCPK